MILGFPNDQSSAGDNPVQMLNSVKYLTVTRRGVVLRVPTSYVGCQEIFHPHIQAGRPAILLLRLGRPHGSPPSPIPWSRHKEHVTHQTNWKILAGLNSGI